MMSLVIIKNVYRLTFFSFLCVLLLTFPSPSEAKRKAIEEIPRRQLDALLQTEDYLAVFWRKSVSVALKVEQR